MREQNEKHEEIKTWVIAISMNRQIDPSLNMDERGCYEASLIGGETVCLPCVVTGYPVLTKQLQFKNNLAANIEDWNKFLMISRVSFVQVARSLVET